MKTLHEVGLIVLGDAVLNHRCAHYQNQNGVWNIFGGRLNWDDRAVVGDDPHFQVVISSCVQDIGQRGIQTSAKCFYSLPPSSLKSLIELNNFCHHQ